MTVPEALPDPHLGGPLIDLSPDVIVAIMRTIHAGWLATSGVKPGDYEVKVTERLRVAMRMVLNDQEHPWSRRMAILPGTESLSRADLDQPDGRTDIPIFLDDIFRKCRDHDPHAIIECKRLAGSDRRRCLQYIQKGINRFRIGKYGARHAAGFMAGYLESGSASDAANGINQCLSEEGLDSEFLQRSTLLNECWARSSCHPRQPPSKPTIMLHHAFLEF